ncbi:MAG TPA: GNAT family N-acetyltransferase [Polyangiaceae bacterium]|nr:GNAT family N-acetyltransferase [Polyangiaceae bacterium]
MSAPSAPPPSSRRVVDPLFTRLEAFYDAVPRDRAGAEQIGPFVLFVPDGPGLPLYARPLIGGGSGGASLSDVEAVRARQRELELPEAFEWVHETTPWVLPLVEGAGLSVLKAPLMVLGPDGVREATAPGATVRLLDPEQPDFAAGVAAFRTIAALAFGSPGTAPGPVGALERDAALRAPDAAEAEREASRVASQRAAYAIAETEDEGALAGGAYQRVGPVAEIVGVATLPAARRRGLGAAVTAALAQRAHATGADLIFLSAGNDDVARLYARLGFRRVGTACIASPPAGA